MIYSTFNEYLTKPKSLTFEEMQELHDMILTDISGDMDGKELYEELIQTAVRYAGIRAEWCLLDREKKAERDFGRTACHDSVIIKFNMLARYLKRGEIPDGETSWDMKKKTSYIGKRLGTLHVTLCL